MCQVRVFNGTDDEFIGPLFHINYFALMDCSWFPRVVFAFLVIVLVLFLKSTADEFLTGALTVICEILELSPDVAGATFLAFGNGAPDVFSTLAAFTKGSGGSNSDLGLGSLLGGMAFVTTVVLGSVIISTKEEIPIYFETFGRDILFLITALLWICGLHMFGTGASIWIGILFLLLYATYVSLVVYQSRVFRRAKCWNDDPDADEPLISLIHVVSDLEVQRQQQPTQPVPIRPIDQRTDGGHTYPDSSQVDVRACLTEDYITVPNSTSTVEAVFVQTDDSANLGFCKRLAIMQDIYWRQLRMRQRAIRYGAKTATELSELNWFFRMVNVIQMPLGFVRALTVPLPETSSWSKVMVTLQPPCATAFIIYVAAQGSSAFGMLMAIMVPSSLLISLWLHFSTYESKPPTTKGARLGFALVSFMMCVLWIYAVAAEIIALFNSFGTVIGANSSILGLSFLAWGNSVGDLVTNVAIARNGMPSMGVAACVASPVFNSLLGLGASLTVVAFKQYPVHVPISLDRYTLAAVILLLIVLTGTLLLARVRNWKLNRCIGLFLIGAYGVYIAVMGFVSLHHL